MSKVASDIAAAVDAYFEAGDNRASQRTQLLEQLSPEQRPECERAFEDVDVVAQVTSAISESVDVDAFLKAIDAK